MYDMVGREVNTLRVMLEGMEATEKERVWVKNQIQGEFDDNKLVDGALGERNVYKRRGEHPPTLLGAIPLNVDHGFLNAARVCCQVTTIRSSVACSSSRNVSASAWTSLARCEAS